MEIILGDKTYNTAGKSKARMFRVAIELSSRMEKGDINPQDLDDLVGFVCDVYGKQFSVGDVYDGLDSDLLMPTITECINDVAGRVADKIQSKNELAAVVK